MKKITFFGLFVAVLCTVFACNPPKSQPQPEAEDQAQVQTPGDVAKEYVGYAVTGDYEKVAAALAVPGDVTTEDFEAQKEAIVTSLKENIANSAIEEKGGVKSIDVVSETIAEDGNSAQVVLKETFGNDETQEDTLNLVKQEDTWKWLLN
jgi:CRISPR/Cas system type I-B associated protein Csh2 (Cas7 group RAMP superfamily)